jgi:hypothetical protein
LEVKSLKKKLEQKKNKMAAKTKMAAKHKFSIAEENLNQINETLDLERTL